MKIDIQSIHFKADKKLEDFIVEKVEKLNGYFEGALGCEVILKLDNNDSNENKIAEIRLIVRGNDMIAKKQSKSFEESTDLAIEALRKQIIKHKEKVRKH